MTDERASDAQPSRRHVFMLEYLMGMRQDLHRQLLLNMGEVDIRRMGAFVDGYRRCQSVNGLVDDEYMRFRDWLRDVKQEFPGEGWDVKYLRDCDGDHERAIAKFLGFVAEFVTLRQRERQQGG